MCGGSVGGVVGVASVEISRGMNLIVMEFFYLRVTDIEFLASERKH